MAFTLPPLPYAYNALAPHIDEETMKIHHDKHHQAYVDNLNKAIEGTGHENKSLEELVAGAGKISPAVRNNGGGHWNHSFFWEILSKDGSQPSGSLSEAINSTFGSFDEFKTKFSAAGGARFGSGWVWLISNGGKLEITSTPNQDNPLMDVAETKGTPIIGVDVWEHAYYLNYQNKRPDYLKAIWNVINWKKAQEHFDKAK
ncbi:MAG: superoxide dismutase [Parafilimonas sp.]